MKSNPKSYCCSRPHSSKSQAPTVISPTLSRGNKPREGLCIDLADPSHRLNLRLDPDGSTLRSAGQLTLRSMTPGNAPVPGGLMRMADGEECLIVYREGTLLAFRGVEETVVATMAAPPRFVLPADDGNAILVMPRGERPVLYRYEAASGSWSEGELYPDLPAITLVRNDMDTVTVPIPALTLKGDYNTTSRSLTQPDADSVTAAVAKAYTDLCAQAAARGQFLQPVVARYRLRALDGSVVYTSAPMVISAAAGMQATRTRLELTGDGGRQASLVPLTATLFTVSHTFSAPLPQQWSRLLQGVEILVSPQLQPYAEGLPSQIRHTASSATMQTFTVSLPGTDRDGASSLPARTVAALLDNEEDPACWTPLSTRPVLTLKQECALISSLLKLSAPYPDEQTRLERRLSPPHSFTAGCGARNGDLMAWGNLEVLPFGGYSPAEMVTGRVHSEWAACPMAAAVTMADGSVHVSSITLSNTEVASFSPLLAYPAPDAVELTLIAGRKRVTVSLHPTPSGRYSYWLSSDLAPLTPGDTLPSFLLPAKVEKRCQLPGAVALCSADTPLRPLAVSRTDCSVIHSIHATPRLANSLNSAESRFYALGTGGVYSLSPALNRSRLRISCIDQRPLLSPLLATEMPGGVAALLDGSLVTFTGTRVNELISPCAGVALAWNSRHRELWLSQADSAEALVTDLTATDRWRRQLPSTGATLLSAGGAGRIVPADGRIYDLNSEGAQGGVTVGLTAVMSSLPAPATVALLSLPLYGTGITGTISLSASYHPAGATGATASATARLFTLQFKHGVSPAHQLMESFIVPHAHYLTLRLELFGSAINLPLN
ncbi:MAG: hypothetical protein K2K72_06990 [Duncaniella sp.]|nr:hypothetical protein [Duncaniella sp.]